MKLCFECGANVSRLSADRLHNHCLVHKRDAILEEFPALLRIDAAIAAKYNAEVKIYFKKR